MKNKVKVVLAVLIIIILYNSRSIDAPDQMTSQNVFIESMQLSDLTSTQLIEHVEGNELSQCYKYSCVHNNILQGDKLHDLYSVKVDFEFVVIEDKISIGDPVLKYLPDQGVEVTPRIGVGKSINKSKVILSERVFVELEKEWGYDRTSDMIAIEIDLSEVLGSDE